MACLPRANAQGTQNPCPAPSTTATAQNGSTNNIAAAEKQNLANAKSQLSALFKKKPATTTAAASPCPAAANASGAAAAGGGAPAASSPGSTSAGGAAAPAGGAAQASAAASPQSNQIPPAPPGGLIPSKLPDILGVHLGTPTAQALAQLNALYPIVRASANLISGSFGYGYNKYRSTKDPPYVASAGFQKPNPAGGSSGEDTVRTIFSGPPQAVLVWLEREITFESNKGAAPNTLRSALIQKYGSNFVENPPNTLAWTFDEQGNALAPASKTVASSCRGIISQQGYPGVTTLPGGPYSPPGSFPTVMDDYLGPAPVPANQQQQLIASVIRGRCPFILVKAQIQLAGPGGVATDLTVDMWEYPEDLRVSLADEQYLQQGANATANQQLKNAQQQAAPTF